MAELSTPAVIVNLDGAQATLARLNRALVQRPARHTPAWIARGLTHLVFLPQVARQLLERPQLGSWLRELTPDNPDQHTKLIGLVQHGHSLLTTLPGDLEHLARWFDQLSTGRTAYAVAEPQRQGWLDLNDPTPSSRDRNMSLQLADAEQNLRKAITTGHGRPSVVDLALEATLLTHLGSCLASGAQLLRHIQALVEHAAAGPQDQRIAHRLGEQLPAELADNAQWLDGAATSLIQAARLAREFAISGGSDA
ncbi:hypothetical protein N8J89_12840 [Crossiella sp. CA-258035]|uniref:hypothetical protein n=1 Tax=Crossiella sp. CA-258035 TaxID=2981138 RepID=UPI0024BBFFCB|nr:hypothetical protein [Crossiella sp. CA-258035]WHT21907.1 hypothetical protein N8J89_12840 [Crossiella sp. CA-258035]